MTKRDKPRKRARSPRFGFRHSGFIRRSCFGFRNSHALCARIPPLDIIIHFSGASLCSISGAFQRGHGGSGTDEGSWAGAKWFSRRSVIPWTGEVRLGRAHFRFCGGEVNLPHGCRPPTEQLLAPTTADDRPTMTPLKSPKTPVMPRDPF